jgi:aminoglycoside phosphotransferase (APT) family kinase protein
VPIPQQRDMDLTRKQLAGWLGARMPQAEGVAVSEIGGPAFSGFSNETLIFDASWNESGKAHRQGFVVRVKPTAHTVFLEAEFETQWKVMQALADTGVPLPKLFWFEDDPSILGAPFFSMGKVDGEVPSDNPPYTMGGWPADADPADQERLWWDGLAVLARIHKVGEDWRGLGLQFLDHPERGPAGLDQQLSYYEEFFEWAAQGRPQPVVTAALEWIKSNRPAAGSGQVGLCWGDSRIGNMIFEDFTCRAVLDWEMVTLGDPLQDLGWWLFLDRHHSEGIGVPPLPGFPTRDATIERYEELTGRTVDRDLLDFYEVFAGFRFAVVMMRLVQLMMHFDVLEMDSDYESNNLVTKLLARMLDLPPPG